MCVHLQTGCQKELVLAIFTVVCFFSKFIGMFPSFITCASSIWFSKEINTGNYCRYLPETTLCFYSGHYFIELCSGDFKEDFKGAPETFMIASALKCVPETSTCAPETISIFKFAPAKACS